MRLILPAARTALLVLLLGTAISTTSGCGLKGDLYLPKPETQTESESESESEPESEDRPAENNP